MVAYVVWSSAFAALPLFLLSFMFEGWPAIAAGFANADTETWAAVLWQTIANLLFGYAVWDCLRGRYPAATVSPMALLVVSVRHGGIRAVAGRANCLRGK